MFIVLVIVIRRRHMEDWDLDHILENWKGFQTLFENLKSIQRWLRYYCLKMMLNEGKTFKDGELSIWTPSNRSGMIKSGVWYIFWDVWRPYSRKNRISYPPRALGWYARNWENACDPPIKKSRRQIMRERWNLNRSFSKHGTGTCCRDFLISQLFLFLV